MRALIDLGASWFLISPLTIEEVRAVPVVVLQPPHMVAGILPDQICFKIKRTQDLSEVAEYSFEGFFPVGCGHDFCGEYTLSLAVRAPEGECGVLSVAEMSFSVFERNLAIELAEELASSLPEDIGIYGAEHSREWLIERWREARPETVFVI